MSIIVVQINQLFTMISKLLSFLLITLAFQVAAQNNKLSDVEKKKGYQLLFDGKSTKGWHTYGLNETKPQWVIEDGALHLKEAGGGDIVTEQDFENFELELEWKISEGGNSGIFYLVQEDPSNYKAVYHTGPEYQVLDDDKHPDGKYPSHRAGANYDLIIPVPGKTKPVGQWNKTKITINQGQVTHFLNGTKVVEYTLWTPQWEEMVRNSKFSKFPGYGKARSGKIALQDHGDKVWYRNIKIKQL